MLSNLVLNQIVNSANKFLFGNVLVVWQIVTVDKVVDAGVSVHNDVDSVENIVELTWEYLEKLLHQGHVEETVILVILREKFVFELLLRVELHGISTPHEPIWD